MIVARLHNLAVFRKPRLAATTFALRLNHEAAGV